MKPAIDQMLNWIEGEMAKDVYAAPRSYMDKGYRVLDIARRQALKIKERCEADEINKAFGASPGDDLQTLHRKMQALMHGIQVSTDGVYVVENDA